MKNKFNLGRLWFPKLINLWGFISSYIIFDFRLQTSDKFFVCEILGIGDDARVHTSLFRIDIVWDDYFEIDLNLFYLFHLKYEKTNKYIIDIETENWENQPWNFRK